MNKPPGYVTTRRDERERATVYDLLPDAGWLVPVGRLDRETGGLLLLSNDTRLAARLTDPLTAVPRVYRVVVAPSIGASELDSLCRGVDIGRGERSTPLSATLVAPGGSEPGTIVEIVLTEQRVQPYDAQALRCLDIEPADRLLVGLKSAVHFRADYGPLARRIFEIDTPGVHHPDVTRYEYRHLQRPIWPLDMA